MIRCDTRMPVSRSPTARLTTGPGVGWGCWFPKWTGLNRLAALGPGPGMGVGKGCIPSEQVWTGLIAWGPPFCEQTEWQTDTHNWEHYLPENYMHVCGRQQWKPQSIYNFMPDTFVFLASASLEAFSLIFSLTANGSFSHFTCSVKAKTVLKIAKVVKSFANTKHCCRKKMYLKMLGSAD